MRIKELHIRNIASIEKADIDFEKELVDPVTGRPSNIFLISGDTGTGKTMILDAIALALYKNTPRIDSVVNKQKNNFTDNEGQPVSISSIEQYTRLGISEKDDCYSELVFEGNDDRIYHARLKLGITKSNRKDADGKYPLHFSKPFWEAKIGTEDWEKTDGQIFVAATGLSFDQFCRMAMLAQGQFAAFLTGDKTERESILEQLTNTSKFTVYGKAISNLFSEAKVKKANAQTVYNTEKEHSHPEDRPVLIEELDALKKLKEETDKEYQRENDRLKIVEDRLSAEKRKMEAEQQIEVARALFLRLSSDLLFRNAALKDRKIAMAQQNVWLNERAVFDELFSHATAVDLQLGQFSSICTKMTKTTQDLKQEKAKTDVLLAKVASCQSVEEQAKATVKVKQEAISQLQAERDALNPTGIGAEKDAALSRRNELEKLQDRISKQNEARLSVELQKHDITNDEDALGRLSMAYTQSQALYEQRAKEEEATRSLLTTMQMSVEDKIVELRRRMREAHADTCPLCGQSVDPMRLADDFKNILTPLQQREEEVKRLLEAATRQRDKDKTAYDKAKGALSIKKIEFRKATEAMEKEDHALNDLANKLSLDATQDLGPQITDSIVKTKAHIVQLDELLKKAENLLSAINRLISEKAPLEEAAQKAGRESLEARNAVTLNANQIHELEKNLSSLNDEREGLKSLLSTSFASYCPMWQEEIPALQQRLKKDAEEYIGQKKLAEQMAQEISKVELMLDAIKSISDSILAKQSGWSASEEAIEYRTANINGEWTQLYAQLEHQREVYKDAVRKLSEEKNEELPSKEALLAIVNELAKKQQELASRMGGIEEKLKALVENEKKLECAKLELDKAKAVFEKWERLSKYFGGSRFRTLVQTYILRPLLNNANIYLEKITDRYILTCSEVNEHLSILVLDRYNKNQIRSATILSGGERFMISLALSLALSSLNRQDMNVDILFIDEGFGTLDETNLNSVMSTLEKLQEIAGQTQRRVGIISHREELVDRIPVKINVRKKGEGRSVVEITQE